MAGQAAGWQGCRACHAGGDHRPPHTSAPRPRPRHPLWRTPRPLLALLSRHSPHRPPPQFTPTHPDPQRRAQPSVVGHQTGSSGVQHGDSAPAPSALPEGSGRPLTRRARSRGPAKNSQARLYLVWPDPDAAARTAPHPSPPDEPRLAPPRAALNGEGAGVTEGEPTPLSAARAGGGALPTAEFSNIACVNHAPRVRQRRAAPGPAPPTSQTLNGYNAAAPSFLPRLDWNPRQRRGWVPLCRFNFRRILPRSAPHHPVSSGTGEEEIYPCRICNISFVFNFLILDRTFLDYETGAVNNRILSPTPPPTIHTHTLKYCNRSQN